MYTPEFLSQYEILIATTGHTRDPLRQASAGRWAPTVQAACGCLAAFTILQRPVEDFVGDFTVI